MRDKKLILQNCMDKAVRDKELAGCNILVLKDGTEKLYAQAGYANVEEKRLFERNTIVRLYSQSKPITSAAAMILIQDGVIDPYEPVGNYIESFKKQVIVEGGVRRQVREDRPMFIKDLLDMTSGLVYPYIDSPAEIETGRLYDEMISRFQSDNMMSTMEFAQRLGEIPLAFQPGEHFRYGTSADVLGAVIEKASGMKFGDFLKERLFDPLEMKDTGFFVPEDKKDRYAMAYHCGEDKLRPYSGNNLGIRDDGNVNAFESGGAGLFSTIDDYANFARMLMNKGTFRDKEILTERTVRFMTTTMLRDKLQKELEESWPGLGGFTYGNLLRIMKDPCKSATIVGKGEYGWDGWLGPYFSNDPESRTTFLMLTQRVDYGTGSATRKFRNIIFS